MIRNNPDNLSENGEPLLIDMDTLCMGHPVFELGSMFNAFIGYSDKMYLGTENKEVCRSVAEKAMIIGYTRMLRRPEEADSPAKIARCKEMLAYLPSMVDTLTF